MAKQLLGGAKASPSICPRCNEHRDKYGRCKTCRNARERKKWTEHRTADVKEATVCGKCGNEKIVGLHCKECKNAANRKHASTKRDYYKESNRQWRVVNKDYVAEKNREYRNSHAEDLKLTKRAYYENNRDKWYDNNKRRRIANPEYNRAAFHKARAKRRSRPGSYTAKQFILLKSLLGNKCFDCGEVTKLEVGHAIPLARGGTNWIDNIIPQCRNCNATQHANIHKDFAIPENPLNDILLNR